MSLVLAAKKHIFSIDSNMRSIRGVCIFFSLFTLSSFGTAASAPATHQCLISAYFGLIHFDWYQIQWNQLLFSQGVTIATVLRV